MSFRRLNNIYNYSYKISCFNSHELFIKKKFYVPLPKELGNKIITYPSLTQLNLSELNLWKHKSFVIYKFDNVKICGIKYDENNNIFTTNYIGSDAILDYKKIYFDINRMNEYFKNLEDLNKYFERDNQ